MLLQAQSSIAVPRFTDHVRMHTLSGAGYVLCGLTAHAHLPCKKAVGVCVCVSPGQTFDPWYHNFSLELFPCHTITFDKILSFCC